MSHITTTPCPLIVRHFLCCELFGPKQDVRTHLLLYSMYLASEPHEKW